MKLVEAPLTEEEQETLDYYNGEGLAALGLGAGADPKTIVEAIGRYVDAERARVQTLDEEEYALFILSMGYLWGTQVCRAYGWEWRLVGRDDDNLSALIVSPKREFAVHTFSYIKKFVDELNRPTTIILLFNMLDPRALASQLPDAQPGGYMSLG